MTGEYIQVKYEMKLAFTSHFISVMQSISNLNRILLRKKRMVELILVIKY